MSQTQIFRGPNRFVMAHSGSDTVPACIDYILHNTAIVKVWANRKVTLDSGGFRTATTKRAINQVANQLNLGFQVFQHNGSWFVSHWSGEDLVFEDGMTLTILEKRHDKAA